MVLPLAPIIGAAIGGGASLLGGLFQNSANAAAAQKQMDFQERMSNTQYQRGVEDMKKAGINPMLAYQQGGASSASGASYVANNVGDAAVRGAVSGSNSAKEAGMMTAQIDNMKADTVLKGANEKAAQAAVVSSLANAQLASQNSATVAALRPFQTEKAMWDAGVSANLSQEGIPRAESAKIEKRYLDSPIGQLLKMFSFGAGDASSALSSARSSMGSLGAMTK